MAEWKARRFWKAAGIRPQGDGWEVVLDDKPLRTPGKQPLILPTRALARAIALDPELIMYDEPFAGLDPISLGTSAQLIRQLNDAMGLTSILVSHDLEETFRVADHVVILGAGGVAAEGTPDEVRASADPLVQQFVNAQPEGPVHFHYPAPSVAEDFARTGGHA